MKSLFSKLVRYGGSDMLPMHMPGHKRQSGFMGGLGKYDITEVAGFDDLHHPTGMIAQAQAEASALYGSDATYFLVNGASCGILSAIYAAVPHGAKLLLARNCHKSALNALTLAELTPVWLYPKACGAFGVDGSVEPAAVKSALEGDADIKAVFIVSPTYEGVVSDVKAIAAICHDHGLPLIVDGAHGAHLRFGADFPTDALSCGADIVVESLHKTLPSLTQTAALHLKSNYIKKEALTFALQIFQSSSPSYLLIASIIECLGIMEKEGKALMAAYYENLMALRRSIDQCVHLVLLDKEEGIFAYDPGKILCGCYNQSGAALGKRLREKYHIETELTAPGYILAMTSVYDTKEALFRLEAALMQHNRSLPLGERRAFPQFPRFKAETVLTPAAAKRCQNREIPLESGVNEIAYDTLYLYPPGSPLVAAGEKIGEEAVKALIFAEEQGYTVHNCRNRRLRVVK